MKRVVFMLIVVGLAPAQNGVGRQFGTRDPITCVSKQSPGTGAPSPDQAARYFRCGPTGERLFSDQLYLFENVKIQIGNGRPYQDSDLNMGDIDPRFPVYPIRGSFQEYQCLDPTRSVRRLGQNCNVTNAPRATGSCYRTTFGDWNCILSGNTSSPTFAHTNLPGPR